MTFEKPAYWDQQAYKTLTSRHVFPQWTRYNRASFLDMVEKGLRHLKKGAVDVLKVDLWNEGIDCEREILSQIKGCSANPYGMDISAFVCFQAKRRNRTINIVQASIEYLPFKSGSFDLLLDLSTLDHISLDKTPLALYEYKRVLRNPGVLVLIFDCFGIMQKFTEKLREALIYKTGLKLKPNITENHYAFPIDVIKDHTKTSGFNITMEYSHDIISWIFLIRKIRIFLEKIPSIYKVIRYIENSAVSKHLKPFAQQYVIIAHT